MEVISNPVELAQKIKEGQGRILVDPTISQTIIKIKGIYNIKYKYNVKQQWALPDMISVSDMISVMDVCTQEEILSEIIKGAAAGFGGYLLKIGLDSVKAKIEDVKIKKAIREKYNVIVTMDDNEITACELHLKQEDWGSLGKIRY